MLWLKLDKNSENLLNTLVQKLNSSLRACGVHWEQTYSSFNGHITIARFHKEWQSKFSRKNEKQRREAIKEIIETTPATTNYSFCAGTITVFESVSDLRGPIYIPLFESRFRA